MPRETYLLESWDSYAKGTPGAVLGKSEKAGCELVRLKPFGGGRFGEGRSVAPPLAPAAERRGRGAMLAHTGRGAQRSSSARDRRLRADSDGRDSDDPGEFRRRELVHRRGRAGKAIRMPGDFAGGHAAQGG